MAKKTCIIYDSWGEMIQAMPAQAAGELIQAICAYCFDDKENDFSDPILSSVFTMIKAKMDEDAANYKKKVDRMNENRRSHEEVSMKSDRSHDEVSKKSDRNHDEVSSVSDSVSVSVSDSVSDSVSESNKNPQRTQVGLVDESALSEPVKEKLKEWLAYKKERREGYKETGLRALITTVSHREQEAGSSAVIDVINDSMSQGYKGIIWDRMKKQTARSGTTVFDEWANA